MECYQDQLKNMMEMMADDNGNINPDEIQKRMFEFFQNNKDEFEKFIGEAINDENFDMNNLSPEQFDIKDMSFDNSGFNLNEFDLYNAFKDFDLGKVVENEKYEFKFDQEQFNKKKHDDEEVHSSNQTVKERLLQNREVRMLKKAIQKKREELNTQIMKEDFYAAATTRDEMREMNKKIMIIRKLEKEGEI